MNNILIILTIYTTVLGGARSTRWYEVMKEELSINMARKEN